LCSSLVLIASLALSACGFTPLYATNNAGVSVVADLAAIAVYVPGDELNRSLRISLEDMLHADGSVAAKYRIDITTNISVRDVAVQQDTSVTRKNLVVTTYYVLADLENGEPLLRSETTAIAAYNRVNSEFANIIAERDAKERAAIQSAEQIRTALAVFFERRNGT